MSEEPQSLRLQLEREEERLSTLQAELRQVESQWQGLEEERARYEPLEEACRSVERLEEAGLSRLFWGDRASDDEVRAHMADVRSAVAELAAEVSAVAARRDSARGQVERQIELLDDIEYELRQLVEQEERRKQEWVVEREETLLPARLQIMPWMRRQEDDRRFQKSLLGTAVACLLLGLLIPYIELPLPERDQALEVPERLARLIRKEPRPMPQPEPVPQQEVAERPPEPQKVEPEPEAKVEPKPDARVAETPAPASEPESVRDQVASKGLLAFRESFSNLANSRPSAKLGSDARVSNAGEKASGLPERAMVATQGPGSSGGINVSNLSRDVGTGEGSGALMEGVRLSRVASSIAGSGGSDRPLSAGAIAGRTDEEIQIVFDRYKAALYRLYNRELRKDPTLRGQMVLRLTIEPDGSVSLCELQDSDMGAPLLAEQVVQRVRDFDFGAKEVPSVTILYPIDFLPTA
jgi:hypothetical protein